jgi:peptide/nickel transport system substrate-binding protein
VSKLRGAVRLGIAFLAAGCALALAGCGGEEDPAGGSATVVMPGGPDYLDPQLAYTTKAAEAIWLAYTPLLTYRHRSGSDGTELIPGLAESPPRISANGRRYTIKLREGLTYSNGLSVRASDFAYTIRRAIELGWGGRRFLTDNIVGAEEFEAGNSKAISGIATDDATGTITVELRRPYGAFSNVLAMPATGLVPRGTPMRDLSADPPPGVGAYAITDVAPNRSWTMLRNPGFERLDIPNIPTGSLDRIKVRVVSNPRSAVEDVVENRADSFDPATPLPLVTLPRINAIAQDRFEPKPIPSTLYFFLNMTTPPFNSELARRAIVTALDRPTLARLGGELVKPDCYLLPDGIKGHPGDCPYGDPDAPGDTAAARELVLESGTAGQPIVVWGEDSSPQRAYVRYYARLLRRLGYRASERLLPPSSYFRTVGSSATNPQTGFARWFNDFPNPIDFYTVVDANSIQPTKSPNLGRVNDLFVQEQLQALNLVPAQELSSAADAWRELDQYTARKAYLAVFGSQQVPKLISNRLDPDSAIIHPLFLSDWSSWSLRDG